MDNKTVVYMIKNNTAYVLATVTTAKLIHFVPFAAHQLNRGGASGGATIRAGSVTLPEAQFGNTADDQKALSAVLSWVEGNDIKAAAPLTAAVVGIEELPEFAYIHKAANRLRIPIALRKNALRNDMMLYINGSPLQFDEFALLLEVCDFDTSLTYAVKASTVAFNIKGCLPDAGKIGEYARERGIIGQLEKIESTMRRL